MLALIPILLSLTGSAAYTIGTGVQATGCTTCTLPPATVPCSTCQTAQPAPPITQAPPAAQWGEWGPFGQCTVTCGGGQRARQRLCNNGCTSCQCIGSALDVETCNTSPCTVQCNTCQQPHYDPPVTQAPCTTCGVYQQPTPCLTCGTPYIQPAPSACTTCGQNFRFYDPYGNAGRRKRSQQRKAVEGPLDVLFR
ncbi:hypothetical protein Q1695_004100 [Nippostrongylus brasiliensis]|nr:hypothetical protein Q1695_004100 [Nippostrongylus brasiliensis]